MPDCQCIFQMLNEFEAWYYEQVMVGAASMGIVTVVGFIWVGAN